MEINGVRSDIMDEGRVNFDFRDRKADSVNKSIIESRAQRGKDANELVDQIKTIKSETESYIAKYKELPKLTEAQSNKLADLIAQAKQLKKVIKDINDGEVVYVDSIDLATESTKRLEKAENDLYHINRKNAKTQEERK